MDGTVADRVVAFPVEIAVAIAYLPKGRFVRLLKSLLNGFPKFAEPGWMRRWIGGDRICLDGIGAIGLMKDDGNLSFQDRLIRRLRIRDIRVLRHDQ